MLSLPRLLLFFLLSCVFAHAETDQSLVTRYLKYRDLPRITPTQIDIAEAVSGMCRDPRDIHGPHIKPGILIYASPSAITAKTKKTDATRYPLGTLFVKEKFETKDSTTPNVITVMEKTTNHNSVNDWTFTMIRLSDRSIVREGFKKSCTECHQSYTRTDFVSHSTDALLADYVAARQTGSRPPAK